MGLRLFLHIPGVACEQPDGAEAGGGAPVLRVPLQDGQ